MLISRRVSLRYGQNIKSNTDKATGVAVLIEDSLTGDEVVVVDVVVEVEVVEEMEGGDSQVVVGQ